MSDYIVISETAAPLHSGRGAASVVGFSTALAAAGHKVTLLTLAPADVAARQSGLAKRLRTVSVGLASGALSCPVFEGRPTASPVDYVVLGAESSTATVACAVLAEAARALVKDGLITVDVAVAWDVTSADALAALPATTRILVESPQPGPTSPERLALRGRGIYASNVIVTSSPSAARALLADHSLDDRASDQPVVPIRFGCDDAPHDPATDPALAAGFSATSLAGKSACRKALGKQFALGLGPKTLLVVAGPLASGARSESVMNAIAGLAGLDAAVVFFDHQPSTAREHARVLTIEQPDRVALAADVDPALLRQLLAGADALIIPESADPTGFAAGLALRYGAIPIAPQEGAFADDLVDIDPSSSTGTAMLYQPVGAFEILGAIRRAAELRGSQEQWAAVVPRLLQDAPRWAATAAAFDSLRDPQVISSLLRTAPR